MKEAVLISIFLITATFFAATMDISGLVGLFLGCYLGLNSRGKS